MTGIAVIGMSGRLPGACDLAKYWENLLAGRDCITRRPATELRGLVPDHLLDDPRWIGASGRITDPFDFDAAFFGMAPKEALLTDPQHRLLLTMVHRALEDGCVGPGTEGRVGVFAGVGRNRHEDLVRAVYAARDEPVNELFLEIGNEKDHSSTKVAYRLGLTGPAITVQSACSTGLVALHQACQSLTWQECDIAVVGAAAVRVPDVHGYLYLEGGIGSADGACRPFSARASGAVAGDGVVAVTLKRLEDALADKDHIRAVIRGSAVNNDGAKAGYGSVSSRAQEQLIRDALLFAETEPDTVASVETHGSGTQLGDAVEWAALSAVYGKGARTLVGSVKSNIGHLREASGLAGFVRTVLSVGHGLIPPTINVGMPADFVTRHDSALALARHAQPWPSTGCRTAAVSAFGLGGTNAHVIVEQPPPSPVASPPGGPALVLVSAHSSTALERTARAWTEAMSTGTVSPAQAAAVSQLGRRHRRHRRFFTVRADTEQPAADMHPHAQMSSDGTLGNPHICFVFPGVGDQYPGMGAGLARILPGYGEHVEHLLTCCGNLLGRDLTKLLSTDPARPAERANQSIDLRRLVDRQGRAADSEVFDPVSSHAVLFCLQLALARGLQRLGIKPAAVTGHSLGELTAATLAGVFTETDALRVVLHRAQLVAEQPEGAMLAVSLPRAQAEELIIPGVWLAAVNSPLSCVLAGEREQVRKVADLLGQRGLQGRLLPVRHAFHTPMLAAAGKGLRGLLGEVELAEPVLPMAANATGTWAGPEIVDPEYWFRQLTSPVLFSQALATAAGRCGVLLEVGPGQLRTLAVQSQGDLATAVVVATMRREYQNESDEAVLLRAVGHLWAAGCEPDWSQLHDGRAWRASLPPTAMDERPLFIGENGVSLDAHFRPLVPAQSPVEPAAQAPAPALASVDGSAAAGERSLQGLVAVVAKAWSEVLGIDDLGPEDDFFELGGDSLMSVSLIFRLEKELGGHIPAVTVFEDSRLGRMADQISAWLANGGGTS
jgi:phthiocerol/phenolphthiocerol synthesis type-I polyketide synthase E